MNSIEKLFKTLALPPAAVGVVVVINSMITTIFSLKWGRLHCAIIPFGIYGGKFLSTGCSYMLVVVAAVMKIEVKLIFFKLSTCSVNFSKF